MPQLAIEVSELTKKFGSFTAVDRLTCEVAQGEIFGFLGANGSGKSTTIRMLCGLLGSTSGSARVAGFDIDKEPGEIKKRIGYMSQRFSLYNDLTVQENIRFFGGIYGLSATQLETRMQWAIEIAGLHGREKSLTRELSGGWKQRLALGCAVLHEPAVVFLDEPTGGVDPLARRRFWDLILTLAEGGTTVFVTTHYLDEAEYCNRIMLLDRGRAIASGSPAELKAEHIRTPVLEVETSNVVEALAVLQEEAWVIETSVFGTALHVSVADQLRDTPKLLEALATRGVEVLRVERIVPSLEDVFIHLIEQEASSDAAIAEGGG